MSGYERYELALAVAAVAVLIGAVAVYPSEVPTDYQREDHQRGTEELETFDLYAPEKREVSEDGFLLRESAEDSFYEVYEKNRHDKIPNFVTSDLVLHAAHKLFSRTLRSVEEDYLFPRLLGLSTQMVQLSREQHNTRKGSNWEEGAKKVLAFFSVARKLLDDNWAPPETVRDLVEREVYLIRNGRRVGVQGSPLAGYRLDYSSFVPRGHYQEERTLRAYFRAMNWYNRVCFRLKPGRVEEAKRTGMEETGQALLIVRILEDNPGVEELWREINSTMSAFHGRSEDLQFPDYYPIAAEVFGDQLDPEELSSQEGLEDFIGLGLKEVRLSALPVWAAQKNIPLRLASGYCFFGKRHDPSSRIFQELVYPKVGTRGDPRVTPTGLDVMAVLGSNTAERILRDSGEFEYTGYEKQLEKLKESFSGGPGSRESLTAEWLGIICQLVNGDSEPQGRPDGPSWELKELNTALGTWTELQHDTVLYTRKSSTAARGAGTPTRGYLEPRPDLYNLLVDFVSDLREFKVPSELNEGLEGFQQLVRKFVSIARKESSGGPLTEEEYRILFTAPRKLEDYTGGSGPSGEGDGEKVSRTPMVVDVHKDPQTGKVLEEGIGRPYEITALVNVNGTGKLVRGATYSYYEFTETSNAPLTDRDWIETLRSTDRPARPEWIIPLFPSK